MEFLMPLKRDVKPLNQLSVEILFLIVRSLFC